MSDLEFDQYAKTYDAALAEGLSVSGEDKEFFAKGRVEWLRDCLRRQHATPGAVMDFGCGTGTSTPYLLDVLGANSVVGVDVSPATINVARETYGSERAQFLLLDQFRPHEQFDLVFCNGVFHHIPIEEREGALSYVYNSLRRGGLFAFWENNPLNPGTRYVMHKCPFDKNAVTLTHFEARRLMRAARFETLLTSFLFIFPKMLRALRRLEPPLSAWPLGAQYMVLGIKR